MPLIAVLPDHDRGLAVLYSSQALYLVHETFCFYTIELALRTPEESNAIQLVLDGVPPRADQLVKLRAAPNFKELMKMGDCTIEPSNSGVWDFRETFFEPTLKTNIAYEGPAAWAEITTVRHDSVVTYEGQRASVPRFTRFDVRTDGKICLISASGDRVAADSVNVVRLGVLLARRRVEEMRWLRAWVNSQIRHRPHASFITRFYSYDRDDTGSLERLGVAGRLNGTTMALTLKAFVDLSGQPGLSAYNETPTSDIWVVGYGASSVNVRSPRVRLDEHTEPRPTGLTLFTQREDSPQSPMWESHFVPRLHVAEFQSEHLVTPRRNVRWEIEWVGEVPGVTIRGVLSELVKYLSPVAVLIALVSIYAPDRATELVPILLIAYFLIVLVALTAYHHVPAIRRFFM
jgi:hypothetical protein